MLECIVLWEPQFQVSTKEDRFLPGNGLRVPARTCSVIHQLNLEKEKGKKEFLAINGSFWEFLRASDRNGSTIIASFNCLSSLKTRMSGARSATGLICSHGSHMDEKIPRPKMPKTALPPELRRKLGFQPRAQDENTDIYKAGSGVLKPKGSGNDGSYLKMKSSIPMSQRTSGLAKMQNQYQGQRALIPKSVLVDSNKIVSD
jgi:hypothetical protein